MAKKAKQVNFFYFKSKFDPHLGYPLFLILVVRKLKQMETFVSPLFLFRGGVGVGGGGGKEIQIRKKKKPQITQKDRDIKSFNIFFSHNVKKALLLDKLRSIY